MGPEGPGERSAVWRLVWRRTRCANLGADAPKTPKDRHGPCLSLRVLTQEGKQHQVYIPVRQAAEVAKAVRRAKGVRKRRYVGTVSRPGATTRIFGGRSRF